MLRYILTASAILLSTGVQAREADWTGFAGCGLYQVRGVGRIMNNALVIVLNEKTQSEIVLHLPTINEPLLAPYLDRPLVAELQIDRPMQGTEGKGTIVRIADRSVKLQVADKVNIEISKAAIAGLQGEDPVVPDNTQA